MFSKFFKRKDKSQNHPVVDNRPIAYPVNYNGVGVFKVEFKNEDFGVVFEDDGETGYLYATNSKFTEIYDSLLLYRHNSDKSIPEGQIYMVLNENIKKAGLFYENQFQVVVDFIKKVGYSRLRSPQLQTSAWDNKTEWHENVTEGLNP